MLQRYGIVFFDFIMKNYIYLNHFIIKVQITNNFQWLHMKLCLLCLNEIQWQNASDW